MEPLRWEAAARCGACGGGEHLPSGTVWGRRLVRCAGCGVVRLHDRVAAECLPRLYAGYYPASDQGPAALARELENPTFHRRRRRLEAALHPARRRIFEVGCGDGNFLAHLRTRGWTVSGSEYDAGSAAAARRRHGIAVEVGELAAAPPGARFSVVAAYHVLEHVYQPAGWLAAARALLEPGGVLHLQVPNWGSATRRLAGVAWASLIFPQHVYFFTPATLGALLERCGFTVVAASTWDPWHGPGTVAASAVNLARRVVSGRLPWSEPGAEEGERGVSLPAGRPRLARRLLDAVAVPLARVEAAAGRGAVVDLVARLR